MHGDVVRNLLESVGACHEVRLAVDFDEHADLAAGVDVATNEAFGGFARGFLGRGGLAFFAQDANGFFEVAIGFDQGGAAVCKAGVGAFAQLFYELGGNVYWSFVWSGLCAHAVVSSLLGDFNKFFWTEVLSTKRPRALKNTQRRADRMLAPTRYA